MAIIDLTGTTWVLNDTINYSEFDTTVGTSAQLDFISNNENYTSMTTEFKPNGFKYVTGAGLTQPVYDNSGGWASEAYKTISITGGTDATNPTLISWLESNGTLQTPSTPRKSVDLTTLAGWEALSSGTHNITIVAKANGYRDSAPSAAVQVKKAPAAQIWGVSGLGNSDPTLTRTFDNVGKTYHINSAAGTITTDFDTEFNFETVVQDGNTMIKIPTFYKRFDTITDNQITAFSISKTKVNDDFIPYPCFVKQDGSGDIMPYILISKGKATGTSSKATCVSGSMPLVHVTRAQMRTAARANGAGWQQFDWMVLQLLRDLFCVVFATTNSQSIFLGRTTGFSAAASVGGTWNISTPCGWNTTTMQNRFFGIEDVFGNVIDWCDGVTFSDSTVYSTVNPSLFSDGTSNMINSGSRITSNGYISALTYNAAQPFLNYPSAASGGETQYYCDYEWSSSSGVVFDVGGHWNHNAYPGLWYSDCDYDASSSNSSTGGRLVYRPV